MPYVFFLILELRLGPVCRNLSQVLEKCRRIIQPGEVTAEIMICREALASNAHERSSPALVLQPGCSKTVKLTLILDKISHLRDLSRRPKPHVIFKRAKQ